MVINEASLPFASLEDCIKNLDCFFDILHEAKLENISFSRADGYEGSWGTLNYANGFEFGLWLNEIADIERTRQIKSVLSNVSCPLINIEDLQLGELPKAVIFHLASDENIELEGIGYAHLTNTYGLSFPSSSEWMHDSISAIKIWDEGGGTKTEKIAVPNVASKEQLHIYIKELQSKRKENTDYFDSLSTSCNPDFPNLLFTESVLKSLKSSSTQPKDFTKIIEVLESLNNAIVSSRNIKELAMNSSLSISGESSATMENRSLARLRTFKHPSGEKLVFEEHVKNFTDGKRLHILCDYDQKTVCIGYFGSHLKTSKS